MLRLQSAWHWMLLTSRRRGTDAQLAPSLRDIVARALHPRLVTQLAASSMGVVQWQQPLLLTVARMLPLKRSA